MIIVKRCDSCKIEFSGDFEKCPLCQRKLSGEAEPSVYPNSPMRKSGVLALAILAFATGVSVLVMLFLGYLLGLRGSIVAIVCIVLVMNYLFVRNTLKHRPDFLRVVMRYFLVLLGLAIIWFLATGNLIVTTFVIPSICMLAVVFDAVLVIVFEETFVSEYAKYLLFDVALGIASLALVAMGLTTWNVPSLVSALISSILLLGLIVFRGRRLLDEVKKLFNT